MIAKELLNFSIPNVKKTDLLHDVFGWMEELGVSQLPLVEEGDLIGIITESSIINYNLGEDTAGQVPISHHSIFAFEDEHLYEIIQKANENAVEIIPVVSRYDNKYMGAVSIKDVTGVIAKMFAAQEPGGVFVISVDARQYSLAEISRLVESNNAKILSCFVDKDENTKKLKVTVKVNTQDLTHILATLERFNYKIVYKYHDYETQSNAPERLSILFKYLDI